MSHFENIYQQALATASQNKITLLHPRTASRSLVIAHLLKNEKCFYFAMSEDTISVESFINHFIHDISIQSPSFGLHTSRLSAAARRDKNLSALLTALVSDIAELSDSPFYLILDEHDRSDEAYDLYNFVYKLANNLPDHCHMIINGRTFPRLPWLSMTARGTAAILEEDRRITENFYENSNSSGSPLDIMGLGPGFVYQNNSLISDWEGHLPRLLFFFVLDRAVVTRSEICTAFWPDVPMDQAINVFHVTKRRLHKALDCEALVHNDVYYSVNPGLNLRYDAQEFVRLLMIGRDQSNPEHMSALQKVVDLYRGPFLQNHDESWIIDRREDYHIGYVEALVRLGNGLYDAGNTEIALRYYQQATNENPALHDIHSKVMKIYVDLRRRSEAAAHFHRTGEALRQKGARHLPATEALYKKIFG